MRIKLLSAFVLALMFTKFASAQSALLDGVGISIGHAHLTVPDLARHTGIWTSLGAEEQACALERSSCLTLPGLSIMLSEGDQASPSIDTVANHVGFTVNDYELYKARLAQIGASIFFDSPENGQILADLPDGVRIEILLDSAQAEPIRFHHVHLAAKQPEELRAWYVGVFGAVPGERRGLPSALLPDGRIDIMGLAAGQTAAGSSSGAIHHVGIEVSNIAVFAEHLSSLGVAFDVEPRRLGSTDLMVAFITDPEGTYIELVQGADTTATGP